MAELDFVLEIFKDYYKSNRKEIDPPSSLEQREFGFILFKEKMMVRHKAFSNLEDLQDFIVSLTPADIYYSSAYYQNPKEPMERKGWLGADLVFDIDADHLDTPCKPNHDFWICENCNNSGRGAKPQECPNCKSTKFKSEAWLCENCLDAAKAETIKLIDFLKNDFGFLDDDIVICFSGQRGYHVHIENKEVRKYNQEIRKEIADYMTGTGLKLELHGQAKISDKQTLFSPDPQDYGWSGRIGKGIQKTQDKILQYSKGKMSFKTWTELASKVTERQASLIDTVVTTDIHRLIRLPFTLHGKTGLKSMKVPAQSLESFDPLKEAIAFKEGTVRLFVNDTPAFRIGDQEYRPYHLEKVELPTAVAVYLLCKRAAKLLQDDTDIQHS